MGIRGLERIIKKHDTSNKVDSIKYTSLSKFTGKYICIDTSEFIVRSLIKDKKYHVSGILNLLEKCFKFDIVPCFVFDGKPPKEKTIILKERSKKKMNAIEKIEKLNVQKTEMTELNTLLTKINNIDDNDVNEKELKDELLARIDSSSNINIIGLDNLDNIDNLTINLDELIYSFTENDTLKNKNDTLQETIENKLLYITNEKKKLKKKCYSYNEMHIKDIQNLLQLLEIPFINSKCESDIICANLCKLGIVSAVISNDMDFIILGCPYVIRNINFRNDDIDLYIYDNILKNLNLTTETLVELSLILGCDYCQRVINIKNKYVYDIFRLYANLDDLILNIKTLKNDYSSIVIKNKNMESEFIKYINEEEFIIDTSIDIKKIKNLFIMEMNEDNLFNMIIYDEYNYNIKNGYKTCMKKLLDIKNSKLLYDEVLNYCIKFCNKLNINLITNKINIICGIKHNYRHNNKYLTNSYTKYKPKQSSNYNTNKYKKYLTSS